jgi:hypothetical protein
VKVTPEKRERRRKERERERKLRERKAQQSRTAQYPIGTVALYGPDDKLTTKLVAAVVFSGREGDSVLERFVGTGVKEDPKVVERIKQLFAKHNVKRVVMTDGNLGCPHEEGEDFPRGGDCPFCPFWKGKQGSGAKH